jgi:hypothetical protein
MEKEKEDIFTEEDLNKSFELGKIVGKEDVADFLLSEAAKEFSKGSDKEANLLRSLSRILLAQTKKEHIEYANKYGEQI